MWPLSLVYCKFKIPVLTELMTELITSVAQEYNLPRSTIMSWETQFRRKNKKCLSTVRGRHLCSGSGHQLSYYLKKVDEAIVE